MTNRARLLEMIKEINEDSHHRSELKPADEWGIEWCWAGHNASHEFELGIDRDDVLWARASGPQWDDSVPMPEQAEGEPVEVFERRLWQWEYDTERWVTSEPYKYTGGYIGHW